MKVGQREALLSTFARPLVDELACANDPAVLARPLTYCVTRCGGPPGGRPVIGNNGHTGSAVGTNRRRDERVGVGGRMRRLLTAAGTALALGVGGVACTSGEEEHEQFVGAGEVCGGLFSGPSAEMVEKVTGHKVFFWRSGNGMQEVVAALKDGYASGRSWAPGANLCRLSPKGAKQTDRGGITYSMYAPQDVEDEGLPAGAELYTMGVQSSVNRGGALLYFECVSPQLKDSDKAPLRIQGGFGRGESDAPDTREYRDMNMRILHAATLKLVKELDCEDNGGLPKVPVLTPK
ncbi:MULTISPECIES: hypothetical protein [Streptomyces]|uniref:Lipoprotein n=1 Tax=Streptomyces flavovirens TaxID=52258 RepID=A0ABV8NHA5_9ACTN